MFCIHCHNPAVKRGWYLRPSDQKPIQRYFCKTCKKGFSTQTLNFDFRLRKRHANQMIFRLLCSSQSQRRCALIFHMKPIAIARRVVKFAQVAERNLAIYRQTRTKVDCVYFDEMESFEHTKCKPLTIPIAVEEKSRKILAVGLGTIAAKGHLAEISRKKYGRRPCQRSQALEDMFSQLKDCCLKDACFKTDNSPHYSRPLARNFNQARHLTFKGSRGCSIGQGELKATGYDHLFCLNHTYAMVRDNLKTMSRRTWCTSKKPPMLKHLLNIYAWFHNLYLDDKKKINLKSLAISN